MRNIFFSFYFFSLFLLIGCSNKDYKITTTILMNYLCTCESGSRYGIYDINNDGNIELLTVRHDSHADGITIHTLSNKTNKLTELGTFGSYGSIQIYPKDGYIEDYYLGHGITEIKIYTVTDDKLNTVVELWTNDGTLEDIPKYKVNGIPVSKENYIITYNEYTSSSELKITYNDLKEFINYETNYRDVYDSIKDLNINR